MPPKPEQPIHLHIADCLGLDPQAQQAFRLAGQTVVADAPCWNALAHDNAPAGARLRAKDDRPQAASYDPDHRRSALAREQPPTRNSTLAREKPSAVNRPLHDQPLISTRGWLAGDTRDVTSRVNGPVYEIDISGIGLFTVHRQSGDITCRQRDHDVSVALFEEALLGPPLAFSLAMRGIWPLHASATLHAGAATLFLGASGKGKSTLAAYLQQHHTDDHPRVADDIVPCTLVDGQGMACLHFPQLKLRPDERYPPDAPAHVPLQRIIVLDPSARHTQATLSAMPAAAAVKALAEQTVAVSLFDRELNSRQLQFIAKLVQITPVLSLRYRHDHQQLSAVARLVRNQP